MSQHAVDASIPGLSGEDLAAEQHGIRYCGDPRPSPCLVTAVQHRGIQGHKGSKDIGQADRLEEQQLKRSEDGHRQRAGFREPASEDQRNQDDDRQCAVETVVELQSLGVYDGWIDGKQHPGHQYGEQQVGQQIMPLGPLRHALDPVEPLLPGSGCLLDRLRTQGGQNRAQAYGDGRRRRLCRDR